MFHKFPVSDWCWSDIKMEKVPEPVLDTKCEMDKLPLLVLEEVLKKVFEFLAPKDRKSGVMVNSLWRKVGEKPYLWAWVQLPKPVKQNGRARVIDMLGCERLTRVEDIEIEGNAVSEDLLQAILNHTGLKRIDVWGELPAGLNPQLVQSCIMSQVTDMADISVYIFWRSGVKS